MTENVKFTEEELKQLTDVRDNYESISYEFGQIAIQKVLLQERDEEIKEKLKQLIQKERDQAEALQKKYGVGSLDIETGEFTAA
tara:strand:- start:5120 stop:5371 length:252 start_codon:yes stop_codon:yes gene_type:complete